MAETVAATEALESQLAAALSEGEAATPAEEDVATIKRRLAGKDQALTRAQQEKAQFQTELEAARRKLAEYEQANMTELERLQRALQEAEGRAQKAQAEARKNALARKSPLYADFLDSIDGLDLTDDQAAKVFEEFVKKAVPAAPAETEPEPRVDPNRPRRSPAQPRLSEKDILDQMSRFSEGILLGAE